MCATPINNEVIMIILFYFENISYQDYRTPTSPFKITLDIIQT